MSGKPNKQSKTTFEYYVKNKTTLLCFLFRKKKTTKTNKSVESQYL